MAPFIVISTVIRCRCFFIFLLSWFGIQCSTRIYKLGLGHCMTEFVYLIVGGKGNVFPKSESFVYLPSPIQRPHASVRKGRISLSLTFGYA